MAERAQAVDTKAAARAKNVVEELLHEYHPRDFAAEFWDGSRWGPEHGQFCRFTWHIHHPDVLRALLRSDRQVALGEAFIHGDFDVSGDLLAIFPVAEYLEQSILDPGGKLRLGSMCLAFRHCGARKMRVPSFVAGRTPKRVIARRSAFTTTFPTRFTSCGSIRR